MPQAYRLSDLPGPRVSIVCRGCDRRGQYDVARLIARHRDIACPHLLTILSASYARRADHDGRCYAVFEHPIDALTASPRETR